jgi:dTDP-glucose 4,6-dehydratase
VLQVRKFKWANIINLDKLTYASNLANLAELQDNPNYYFIGGDINNSQSASYLLEEYQPDTLIIFAAETHVDCSIISPHSFIHINVVGTFELLEASKAYWQKLTSPKRKNSAFCTYLLVKYVVF